MIYAFLKAIARVLFRIFGKLKVEYRMPIPEGGVILACNHISDLDPPVLAAASTRPVYFLAKKELFQNRLVGAILRGFKAYPLDRSKGDLAAIKRALGLLKEEKVLGIFPEGTRVKGAQLGKPHNGAAFLAVQAKVPIVPVAISGTGPGFRGLFLGKVRMSIEFLEPITVEQIEELVKKGDLDKHQKLDMIRNEITDRSGQALEGKM